MKVWLNEHGLAVYQHYEKPVANRQVVDSLSALSSGCKKSVHVNGIVTKILNTSTRLQWSEYAAPTITDYMARMKQVMMSCTENEHWIRLSGFMTK